MNLTAVKMIEGEDQQKEPESSGCAFLGQELDSAMKVEEEGMAFHTENQMPPTVAILDLGCTRAMGSRNAINALDKHDCGLWYKIEPTSSRFSRKRCERVLLKNGSLLDQPLTTAR